MSGRRAKKIRRTIERYMQHDIEVAWVHLRRCPWRARLVLAWRLMAGRELDGSRKAA